MRPIRTSLFAAAVGLLTVGVSAGPAAAATVKADYGIWLGGLPLGSADLATTVDGPRYRMQLQVRLTGLAGLLTGGKGAATAAGLSLGRCDRAETNRGDGRQDQDLLHSKISIRKTYRVG